jgi:hypothetical protein
MERSQINAVYLLREEVLVRDMYLISTTNERMKANIGSYSWTCVLSGQAVIQREGNANAMQHGSTACYWPN